MTSGFLWLSETWDCTATQSDQPVEAFDTDAGTVRSNAAWELLIDTENLVIGTRGTGRYAWIILWKEN